MNQPELINGIQAAADLIKSARHAVALTGAGISTPSGIPDFRSQNNGLWTQNDPMVVASLSAFRNRPETFFNWLRPLAERMANADPNPAHYALAELENAGVIHAVITQNIDGLHQRAGSKQVIEVHGTATSLTCLHCHRSYLEQEFRTAFIEEKGFPKCPQCQSILKPDIVLFEELLPETAWSAAEDQFRQSDLILVAGSSLEVSPANQLPFYGLDHGAKLIIINFTPTPLDSLADLTINADVAIALPLIKSQIP